VRRILAALVVLGVIAAARGQDRATYTLEPKWAVGDLIEVEGKFVLALSVKLEVPKASIARTTTEVQAYGHRMRDKVLAVAPSGERTKVRRHYVEAWVAIQEPGERAPTRSAGPLDKRTIELSLDEKGKLAIHVPEGAPPLPAGATEGEKIGERWEGVLPPKPVAIGETWTIKGEPLGKLFEALGAKPEGQLEARLAEVKEKPLEKDAKPEKVAIVAITIAAKKKPDPTAEDDAAFEARLVGTLEFALARQKIVGLDLKGEGIVDQERKDDKGNVMTIKGHGPLEVVKKVRFPKTDEKK
jgi:hypothetical protein